MITFGIILAAVIVIFIVNIIRLVYKYKIKPGYILRVFWKDILSGLQTIGKINYNGTNFFNQARYFLFNFTIILFCLMAFSGMLWPLFWQPAYGFMLFVHILIAPFFALSVTFSIALFANKMQFTSPDYQYLGNKKRSLQQKYAYRIKIYFWLFALAPIFNVGSIVLALYPVLGTPGQTWLLNIHRYSALILLGVTLHYLTFKYSLKVTHKGVLNEVKDY